jgi:hypothetical protein
MKTKPTINARRIQLVGAWTTEAEARAIREFKARLALDGVTYKDWLSARIAEYVVPRGRK